MPVSPDVWIPLASGFIGAATTGILGLVGIVLVSRNNRKSDRERWMREQKLEAYAQLASVSQVMAKSASGAKISDVYPPYFKAYVLGNSDVIEAANDLFDLAVPTNVSEDWDPVALAKAMSHFANQVRQELDLQVVPAHKLGMVLIDQDEPTPPSEL